MPGGSAPGWDLFGSMGGFLGPVRMVVGWLACLGMFGKVIRECGGKEVDPVGFIFHLFCFEQIREFL